MTCSKVLINQRDKRGQRFDSDYKKATHTISQGFFHLINITIIPKAPKVHRTSALMGDGSMKGVSVGSVCVLLRRRSVTVLSVQLMDSHCCVRVIMFVCLSMLG